MVIEALQALVDKHRRWGLQSTALEVPNAIWSLDFTHHTRHSGRRFRKLNVLVEGVREVLDIEVDTSLSGERVVWVLGRLRMWKSLPMAIRWDTSPELVGQAMADWWGIRGWAQVHRARKVCSERLH